MAKKRETIEEIDRKKKKKHDDVRFQLLVFGGEERIL